MAEVNNAIFLTIDEVMQVLAEGKRSQHDSEWLMYMRGLFEEKLRQKQHFSSGAIFDGDDNNGHPKSEYLAIIATMDEDTLVEEAKDKMCLSIRACEDGNSDFHWQDIAIQRELSKRGKEGLYASIFQNLFSS